MKPDPIDYEQPVRGVAWTRGAGHPAGIYHLDGRVHFAAHQSPAERVLQERGALLVASVRFDRDPLEATHPDRSVRAVDPADAVRALTAPARN